MGDISFYKHLPATIYAGNRRTGGGTAYQHDEITRTYKERIDELSTDAICGTKRTVCGLPRGALLDGGTTVVTIHEACDYIIVRLTEAGTYLNVLKLHKLLYYFQSWSLAHGRGHLFEGNFQAWVHGPVNRVVYNRFAPSKMMYSVLSLRDLREDFNVEALDRDDRAFMDAVLEVYAPLTGDQLEQMTHDEEPWIEARHGVAPNERSENVINDETMRRYYAARLN
ncbi:Panacea domain-containing protein [Methylobacterium tarhaniae]|uniref:Panacea domain-containing protein n=1 Tax=Methylobacterium tarhaniae TaxID=1187852 RepID=UPI003D093CB7